MPFTHSSLDSLTTTVTRGSGRANKSSNQQTLTVQATCMHLIFYFPRAAAYHAPLGSPAPTTPPVKPLFLYRENRQSASALWRSAFGARSFFANHSSRLTPSRAPSEKAQATNDKRKIRIAARTCQSACIVSRPQFQRRAVTRCFFIANACPRRQAVFVAIQAVPCKPELPTLAPTNSDATTVRRAPLRFGCASENRAAADAWELSGGLTGRRLGVSSGGPSRALDWRADRSSGRRRARTFGGWPGALALVLAIRVRPSPVVRRHGGCLMHLQKCGRRLGGGAGTCLLYLALLLRLRPASAAVGRRPLLCSIVHSRTTLFPITSRSPGRLNKKMNRRTTTTERGNPRGS
ncbi:hypothetical protein HDK77DRAFT_297051 [Phyllosticta capitalensis]